MPCGSWIDITLQILDWHFESYFRADVVMSSSQLQGKLHINWQNNHTYCNGNLSTNGTAICNQFLCLLNWICLIFIIILRHCYRRTLHIVQPRIIRLEIDGGTKAPTVECSYHVPTPEPTPTS